MTLHDAFLECLVELDPPRDAIVTAKLEEAFLGFLEYVPEEFRSDTASTLTVPLYSILKTPGEAILNLCGPLFHTEILAKGYFPEVRKQLHDNENAASGISSLDRALQRKKVVGSDEYDAEPEELVRIYLRHTPFYQLLHTQVPFRIPRKTFASHGIILAPPNHGKTQLLGSIIHGFLTERREPVGCFVLDPHGDLYETLRSRVDPERLLTLDPDTSPPPLNFLDFGTSTEAQTLQTFSYLMSSLSGGLSDKQGAIVPYLLKLLRQIPDASLETLRLLVDEKVKTPEKSVFAPAIAKLAPVDQGFFHNQFYSGRMQETKDAIGWKLYSALSSDAFREMFSAKTNSINFDEAIAQRKVVLVKGARNALGEDGMRVFLQFVLAQYIAAGFRRDRIPENDRHLCIMFADECQMLMESPLLSTLFEQLRKFACGFIGATQTWHQIAEQVKSAVLGATAIKVVGPVSFSDASLLSREMYTTPDFIRSMKAKEASHADWAFYVSGMTDKAVKVRVRYGALEKLKIYQNHQKQSTTDQQAGPIAEQQESENHRHNSQSLPQTHEAPEKGASRGKVLLPPEGDKPIIPPHSKPKEEIHTDPSRPTPRKH